MKKPTYRNAWTAFTLLFVCLFSISSAAEAINIATTSLGDGHYHNEFGTSYDYFDSTSTSVLVNRYYDGFSTSINDYTGYLQFSLSSLALSPGDVIGSAFLNVYLEASSYADDSPSAGFINHVANSSSANGNASQRLDGNERVIEIKDQPLGWLLLDVTDYLKNDQIAGYSYASFSLNMNTDGYYDNASFSITSADANNGNAPYLSIVVVPEPSAYAWLMSLGIGTFALLKRRHLRSV